MKSEPVFRNCNVCGRELALRGEFATGMCFVCADEEVPSKPQHRKPRMSDSFTVESTTRKVIEDKLLTALEDSATVAILASEEDLAIMIEALRRSDDSKARQMAEDFGQLKRAAFTKK